MEKNGNKPADRPSVAQLLEFIQKNADGTYTAVPPSLPGVQRVDFCRMEEPKEVLFYSFGG
jgi:hypothetical protein